MSKASIITKFARHPFLGFLHLNIQAPAPVCILVQMIVIKLCYREVCYSVYYATSTGLGCHQQINKSYLEMPIKCTSDSREGFLIFKSFFGTSAVVCMLCREELIAYYKQLSDSALSRAAEARRRVGQHQLSEQHATAAEDLQQSLPSSMSSTGDIAAEVLRLFLQYETKILTRQQNWCVMLFQCCLFIRLSLSLF